MDGKKTKHYEDLSHKNYVQSGRYCEYRYLWSNLYPVYFIQVIIRS